MCVCETERGLGAGVSCTKMGMAETRDGRLIVTLPATLPWQEWSEIEGTLIFVVVVFLVRCRR